jgi:lipoate-protein ligase A
VPEGHWLTGLDRLHSYRWLNRSVQAGLERCHLEAALAAAEIPHHVDRQTMVCFANPTRYDVLMDGRKIAGSAQRRTREGLLHQGSLHFGGPLPLPRTRLAQALIEGFSATLKLDFVPFVAHAAVLTLAQRLTAEKYAASTWNQRR